MKKILIALVAIFALTQCKPANEQVSPTQSFTTQIENYGAYNGTEPVYAYNIDKHQTSARKTPSYQFVMQSDDQTEYLLATITSLPEAVGMTADVNLEIVGAKDFKNGVRKMEVLKIDGGKAWLWSEQELLGLVVAVPVY